MLPRVRGVLEDESVGIVGDGDGNDADDGGNDDDNDVSLYLPRIRAVIVNGSVVVVEGGVGGGNDDDDDILFLLPRVRVDNNIMCVCETNPTTTTTTTTTK